MGQKYKNGELEWIRITESFECEYGNVIVLSFFSLLMIKLYVDDLF